MAVTDYLQKTGGTCRYSYSKLKDVLYLVSAEHLKDVHIDNGEAYIDYIEGQEELPLRINGFNIQFNEETSLDERYKFQKTLTLSMHGYVNYKIFEGKYYGIIEDVEGTFWMINVDFPSRITHTFNLGKDTNQTDFTFSSLSNYPTLKLNADFEAVSPVCLGLNVHGIDKLELIEFEKAKLNTINRNVTSTEPFKKIEFLGDSCTFQEVYDGNRVTDTISFNIAFDNYKPSWRWNLLEFLDNKYSAIITPKGNDNKYYTGYNLGLNPSYTIQTASNNGESDIITITLVEMSSYGSTAAVDWDEEHSTETRWRYVKNIGETICWECVGYSLAKYLVRQETDLFGNPTGNYQVMDGYESQFSNLHIVGTFTEEELFQNTECATATTCDIQTNIPNAIYYNAATCYTYNLKTSCDWEFDNIPNNITVSPLSGEANSSYTVSICNTVSPSSTPLENYMTLNCCSTSRVINLRVQNELSCVRPLVQNINCLSQNVQFAFDGDCNLVVTSISSALTYSFDGDYFVVNVPKNTEDLSRTYTISVTNCNCSTETTNVTIVQDKMYSVWSEDMTGYMCENGNKYKISRLYTGTTLNNLVRTDETKTGSLIESGSTDCATSITKWDWDNESYYCVGGNKFKTEFEYISYDGGNNWVKTGNTRLGSIVETESEWCNSAVTYSWVASTNYECSGTTSYYMYQKYEQRGEEDPIPVYPSVLSIDADGTQPLNKKMDNDTNCGYSPVIEPIYRWINLNISSDYVCDVCSFTGKWIATYSGGTTSSAECDASSAITSGEITLTDLVDVEIGDCVTSIGNNAFDSCSGLTGNLVIPNSVTSIGFGAFQGCSGLTSCTIGSGVTSIGGQAFLECTSLTSIDVPNNVTSIGNSVFNGCTSLTNVTIGSGVTSIGDGTFDSCSSLRSVNIPSGVTSIGSYAFNSCSSLTSIDIPDSITSIGEGTFYRCSGLTSIDIPDSVTSIGWGAFRYCSGLTSVTVNATTPPTLGSNAFNKTNNCPIYVPCQSVDSYKAANRWSTYASRIQGIPPCGEPTPTSYKWLATYTGGTTSSAECNSNSAITYGEITLTDLVSVEIGDCVKTIDSIVFDGCTSLTGVTMANSVTSIGDEAFNECDSLTDITLSNSLTSISIALFRGCLSLSGVTIPNSVASIGDEAFEYCASLTSINIPSGVTSIGQYAFNGCSGLTSCTIGSGVTSIGEGTFYRCSGLTSIDIPNSVTSIGNEAFRHCSGLTSLTVESTTPPTLGSNAFRNTQIESGTGYIYVPSASVNAYKAASGWSTYASRIQAMP